MTPEEKAAAIAAACGTQTLTFSHGGVNFAVSEVVATGPTVWFTAQAWTGQGGNKAYLPVDDRYVITNPPLMLPDGGTAEVTIPRGRGQSEVITVKTFTRDDIAAAKQIVYEAVVGYALRHGWTP